MNRTTVSVACLLTITLLAPLALAAPPAAPSNVAASNIQDDRFTITFTPSPNKGDANFVGHFIYRDGNQACYLDPSDPDSCVLAGLTPETQYSITVKAASTPDGGTTTEYSTEAGPIQVTTAATPTTPQAPTSLAATAFSATQIDLTWTAPSSGDAPSQYFVYQDGSQVGSYTSTSASIINLQSSTEYCFRVSGSNSAGEGPQSNEDCATTQASAASIPSAPRNLELTTWDERWTAAYDAPLDDGGAAIQGYNVYIDGTLTINGGNPNELEYTRTATNGDTLLIEVRAKNEAGEGPGTSASITIGAPNTAPSAPTLLSATSQGAASILVDWGITEEGGIPASYKVFRSGTHVATMAVTALTDDNLLADTQYCYTVKASNQYGDSPNSNGLCATTDATTADAPGAVQGLGFHVYACTCSQGAEVNLSWMPPASDGGAALQYYNVYLDGVLRTQLPGNTVAPFAIFQGSEALPHDGLDEGTYTAVVKARNEAGEGPGSDVTFTINYGEIPNVTPKTQSGGSSVIQGTPLMHYAPGLVLGAGTAGAAVGLARTPERQKGLRLGLGILAAGLLTLAIWAFVEPSTVSEAIGL